MLRPTRLQATLYWQGDPASFDHDALVSTDANRWNDEGQTTAYLAGDVGLALVEAGRHLREPSKDHSPRGIWSVDVDVPGIVDLRSSIQQRLDSADSLSLLDRGWCRQLAADLRHRHGVAGLIVPSAGCLDDMARWNLVLFVDRVPGSIEDVVRDARPVGRLEL